MIDPEQLSEELASGFAKMSREDNVITVFGSSRFGDDHPFYELGRAVGRKLAELGYTVVTGGGPGMMEAANRGANEAGGRSLGCTIQKSVGPERDPRGNRWCDDAIAFETFSARKAVMIFHAKAFVVMPGGFGTMDELYEVLTLRQTRKIPQLPIVLVHAAYWAPTMAMLRQTAIDEAVGDEDIAGVVVVDTVAELAAALGH